MNLRNFIEEGLEFVNVEIRDDLSDRKERLEAFKKDGIELIGENHIEDTKDSRFIPIKLRADEFKRALECQRRMLDYARMLYRKSIGTFKEENMRKFYNDAIADYKAFVELYGVE